MGKRKMITSHIPRPSHRLNCSGHWRGKITLSGEEGKVGAFHATLRPFHVNNMNSNIYICICILCRNCSVMAQLTHVGKTIQISPILVPSTGGQLVPV